MGELTLRQIDEQAEHYEKAVEFGCALIQEGLASLTNDHKALEAEFQRWLGYSVQIREALGPRRFSVPSEDVYVSFKDTKIVGIREAS